MLVHGLLIGFLLASQVGSANERYPISGGQQAGPTQQGEDSTSPGLVPVDSPPASGGAASVEPLGSGTGSSDPYSGRNQPGTTQPRSNPLRNGVSAPPPFNSLQNQPSAPPAQPPASQRAKGPKPTAMMRAMLAAPRDSQLSGEPVQLIEVVSGATSRMEQTQRVEAYWDLCSSVADYYLGLREREELRGLRSSVSGGGAVWQQAESEMAVRVDTSLRAARASQLRIADWVRGRTGALPLPADRPHCGSYHSRYEEIFAGQSAPEAEELAELLPLRYAELKDAASAVARAEEWLGAVAKESSDGIGALRALEFLALRRRAFVQIARDYNRRIARYTELASPGDIGADRLIGMLIKTESTSTATRPGSAPGRQSSNVEGEPPKTFADEGEWEPAQTRADTGRRDEAVQPASGTSTQGPQRERSLLVSPRK
jgi:hypothetical protein